MSWFSEHYDLLRGLHIIAVIAWMAGMLYLPRLYVYHTGAIPGGELDSALQVMEVKLLRIIINPAMIASFVFGILLALTPGLVDWSEGWIWVKLAAVLGMSAAHGYFSRWRREFAEDRNRRPAGFYRKVNEIPTVLLIVIVVMVAVKPF